MAGVERAPITFEANNGKELLKIGEAVDATVIPYESPTTGEPTMLYNSVLLFPGVPLLHGAVEEAKDPLKVLVRVRLEDTVVLRSVDSPQRSTFLSRGTPQTAGMLGRNYGVTLTVNEKNCRLYI